MRKLLTLCACLALSIPPSTHAVELTPKDIDGVVRASVEAFAAPGVAVAVVRDDRVIHLEGYGVRDLGQPEPITPDTLFPIASCSKAFTATAVGMLIDDGKMAWDDPVRKHLPYFRLSDPLADREVTLRDALCHRVGMARHDVLRFSTPLTNEAILRRLAPLPLAQPFRARFLYNNLMFLAAAEATAAAKGRPWGEVVRERIFTPLGMKTANTDIDATSRADNHADPHVSDLDGKVGRIDWKNVRSLDGGGKVCASARDLSRWLRFQLADGVIDGKRLIRAATLKETHTAQQVVQRDETRQLTWPAETTDHLSYALGWQVHDYRGRLIVSHGGSLPGFRSHTILVPKAKLGMVVLCNLNGAAGLSPTPEAITKNLLDRFLDLPARDWNAFYRKAAATAVATRKKTDAEKEQQRQSSTKPSLALNAYVGKYQDVSYGPATVTREENGLGLRWGDFAVRLEHFHFDTFRPAGENPLARWGADDRVVFRLGADGKVESATFLARTFRREKEPPTPPAVAGLPATKKEPVKDTYHGVTVVDDYRWLEDGKAKNVRAWSDAQNAYARSVLDKLPGVSVIRGRVKEILAAKTTSHGSISIRGDRVFAIKRQPPKEQPFLVVMPSLEQPDKARTLVDPTTLDAKGTTAIDWYVPSPDGKLVAVSLSKGGSESGDVHIYDVETGKTVYEVVPRVHGGTAGGDLAWTPDGKGFYYTRYPRGDERPEADRDFYQQLWFHQLGTSGEKDRYEMGRELPRIAEITLEMDDKSGRLLASVQDGDSGRFAHFVRSAEGKWRQFSKFGEGVVDAVFGPGDSIFAVSRKDAPRGKLLRLNAAEPDVSRAEVVIPEGKDTIVTDFYRMLSRQTVLPTADRLYILYQLGGPSEVRAFDLKGKALEKPKQFPVGRVGGLVRLGANDLIFSNNSYVEAPAVFAFHAKTDKTERLPLTSPAPVSFDDIEVVREFATSKDGTKVPVNILIPKGAKKDGKNPCLVTGYGGYGLSREPSFRPVLRVLFDHGFVWAEANLRGGGEFGEAWHHEGALTKKQNVFDDFAAVLKHMIAQKYTSPEHLAIEGGSNGGLLMGAMLTQHPELVRAVVTHVGIYDMLRVELSPNGAFNIPEFGSVKDADQFKALHAYSPLHNVKDGVKYPAVLFLTGANDPRVDPMQSRKMSARLQAAGSGRPVLLRTSASSGHGLDTSLSERVEEYVDVFAFLFEQLSVKVREKR